MTKQEKNLLNISTTDNKIKLKTMFNKRHIQMNAMLPGGPMGDSDLDL